MIFTSSVQIVLLQARLSSDQGSSAVRVLGVFLCCAGDLEASDGADLLQQHWGEQVPWATSWSLITTELVRVIRISDLFPASCCRSCMEIKD